MSGRLDMYPRWLLYALALFLPFSISGAQLALALLVVLLAIRAVGRRRWPRPSDPVGWLIAAMIVWIFIAAPFAQFPEISLPRLAKYWIWLTYFVVLAVLDSEQTARRALTILVCSAGVTAVYGIAQHFFGDAVPRYLAPEVRLWVRTGGYYHAVGLFDHHLTYGNSLIIVILLGVGMLFSAGSRRWRLALGAALGLALMALLWSYARSAWIGLFFGLLVFGGLKGQKAMLGTMLLLLLVGLAAEQFSPSIKGRLHLALTSDKNFERIYTWKTTGEMIADHPLVGVGPGAYRQLTPPYRRGYNFHWTASSHAHNSYLQFAVESGLPAGLLFAVMLAVLFAFGATRHHDIKDDIPGRHLLAGAVGAVCAFAAASMLQHNAGDAEVCMVFQLAAAMLMFFSSPQTKVSHESA